MTRRANNNGFALVGALFMVLIVSVIGSSLVFVSRTETLSSLNYKTMSQGRYAAESAIHRAANHLMFTYNVAAVNLADFNTDVSPVQYDGGDVILSSNADDAHYPDAAVIDAFAAATEGMLEMADADVHYSATAKLISMRQITSAYTQLPVTLQTWEITGIGSIDGAASSAIEVSTIMEHETRPAFTYAAFATAPDCGALTFAGGAETSSYDSSELTSGTTPPEDEYGADVGTNGNLTTNGNPTDIRGTLSTPRTGLGACSSSSVTAATLNQETDVDALIRLPQAVSFPTPDAPSPLPPTTAVTFGSGGGGSSGGGGRGGGSGGSTTPEPCPTDVTDALTAAATAAGADASTYGCTATLSGGVTRWTLDPPELADGTDVPVTLGDVRVGDANTELHIRAGTIHVNTLTVNGSASLIVDDGPVLVKVAGQGVNPNQSVVDLEGSADLITPNYDPAMLQFVYAGTSSLVVRGSAQAAMLVYAPNADVRINGQQTDFFGAVVGNRVTIDGAAEIHYDRNLARAPARSAAEWTISAFTWKAF